MIAENRDGLDHDTVLEVFQKGYLLGQELIRPARVKVGKPATQPEAVDQIDEGGE